MKSPPIMYMYAAFLIICGLVAFAMSGFERGAITALIAPGIAASLMVVCGVMAGRIHTSRVMGMIGIHVGLVLPILYGSMFAMLSYRRFTQEEPTLYLAWIFAVLTAGSLLTFIALLLTRPKPEART